MTRTCVGPLSYREISHRLGISKNTVLDIVKRDRAA
jgi:DNA-binding Lrp family transcriptional regulator